MVNSTENKLFSSRFFLGDNFNSLNDFETDLKPFSLILK